MISARRFENINGHVPVVEAAEGGGYYACCECNCGAERVTIVAHSNVSERGALSSLLHEVLQHHGRIVMERAGWACERCRRIRPLSAHHRVRRSKQRSDLIPALEAICVECHAAEHGNRLTLDRF